MSSEPAPAVAAESAVDDGIPGFLKRKPADAPAALQHLAPIETLSALPALVDRAATALAGARTAAEVLEARDMAGVAYDAAKKAARFHKVKGAHDTLIAAAHCAQADALEIEAGAKRRLADEYDAAQERGEVATKGKPVNIPDENIKATVADIGLTSKQIHEAREVRDAEDADPGIVRRTLDEAIAAGEEPTRAKVKRAVKSANPAEPAKPESDPRPPTKREREREAKAAKRQAEQFEHGISAICGTCEAAANLKVPELDHEKEVKFINDLRGAKTALTKLIKKIHGEPIIAAPDVKAETNAFHRELLGFFQNIEPRLTQWAEDHPNLEQEAKQTLMNALYTCADGFSRLAQALDGR
jgi:hypothetical protein